MAKNNPKKRPAALDADLPAGGSAAATRDRAVRVFVASIFELFGFAAIIPLRSVMKPRGGHSDGGRRGMIPIRLKMRSRRSACR